MRDKCLWEKIYDAKLIEETVTECVSDALKDYKGVKIKIE
jgi:hypothetical protein